MKDIKNQIESQNGRFCIRDYEGDLADEIADHWSTQVAEWIDDEVLFSIREAIQDRLEVRFYVRAIAYGVYGDI